MTMTISNTTSIPPKSRQSAAYWQAKVRLYRHSGLTQQQFCEREGINYSSFKNWSCHFKEEMPVLKARTETIKSNSKPVSGRFIPAVLSEEFPLNLDKGAVKEGLLSSRSLFEMRLRSGQGHDFSVFIPQGFDEGTLYRLLQVMGCLHA